MYWCVRLLLIVGLTTLTGSIFTLVWFAIGNLLEKAGYLNIVFVLLNEVALFWVIPLAYIFLIYRDDELGGRQTPSTPWIMLFAALLCTVWVGGCVYWLVRYLRDTVRSIMFSMTAFPCKIGVSRVFDEVSDSIGLRRGRCRLVQSYQVQIPCVSGIFRPRVYLPVKEYAENDLRIMFLHELIHYKQKDLWLKQLTGLVYILNWFNPIMWSFQKWVSLWSEFSVDYKACRVLGDMKLYAGTIFSFAYDEEEVPMIASRLIEKKSDEVERVRKMTENNGREQKPKAVVAALVLAMMTLSTGTVYAASAGIAEGYVAVYDHTDLQSVESQQDANGEGEESEDLVEFIDLSDDSEYLVIEDGAYAGRIGGVAETKDLAGSFNWSLAYNVIHTSSSFKAKTGGYIQVTASLTPTNLKCYVGIVQPNLVKRCVYGKGTVAHEFDVQQTGTHWVYVRNNNSTTVTARGSYAYFAP